MDKVVRKLKGLQEGEEEIFFVRIGNQFSPKIYFHTYEEAEQFFRSLQGTKPLLEEAEYIQPWTFKDKLKQKYEELYGNENPKFQWLSPAEIVLGREIVKLYKDKKEAHKDYEQRVKEITEHLEEEVRKDLPF